MELEIYVKKRNSALLNLDIEELKNVFAEAGVDIPNSEIEFWAGVHRARLQVSSFPPCVKAESVEWLHANGYAT